MRPPEFCKLKLIIQNRSTLLIPPCLANVFAKLSGIRTGIDEAARQDIFVRKEDAWAAPRQVLY